ncbi:2,5-didehydrogluconate reductase DkgB [Marinobacter koreensis]|uniref:2,5-didehydrogluconate reductase DkgB n=1 Tax=Marinobacter koreensis TaxID=335974 RepID=A0ABW0RME6_9GAMM|nr:2,5-didehydrogluconate reductase DkgB [Marinobacter koreensis]MCK7549396.1 2,5-didehydrogluconate reductase DkgB [Marinobacter koreensis]MDX1818583.1 2,5-didehydrogluconate reductase DkgB [Marinobacter sp.]
MSFTTLPKIGMGTFRLKGNDARDAVKSALSLGYRHIDTAQMYDNEAAVGDGITSSGIPRREIFLTTKIWHDKLHASDLINSLQGSLDRLKTDHVDLALIHWPSPGDEVPMEEYLGALKDAQREGLAEHIGISNFTCAQMDEAKRILGDASIFTNQVEVHPFLANRKVVDHARKLGITVTGYMPLAVGKVMEDETLQRIAENHNATPAQIAIAWVASRGIVPIPSSTRPAHQKANLDALEIELSGEDIKAIDALDRGERIADPGFAPDWD